MLDWLTATDRFVETGDGQKLAKLLKSGIPSGAELRDDPSTRPLRTQLQKAAEAIETISLALSVTRPIEAMQSAVQLEETLQQAAPSFAQRAKPFAFLTERVVEEYGQFAMESPMDTAALAENLRLQLQMIGWYLKRDKLVQAVTLAREWLVSLLVLQFDDQMFEHTGGRKQVETALNNAVEQRKPKSRKIDASGYDRQFESLVEADELAKLWSQMTDLRNDIAHVGMNLQPKLAANLKKTAESLYPRLLELEQKLLTQ